MNINYWNMINYMPLFGLDSLRFDELRQDIGNKASCRIQKAWQAYKLKV